MKRTSAALVTLMGLLAPAHVADAAQVVEYRMTFDATWTHQTHPLDYPGNAHFSSLAGGTHNADVSFWEVGGIATSAIEGMAELGGTNALFFEVNLAIVAGDAFSTIDGSDLFNLPGSVSSTFTMSADYPLVTLVTMVAPSPDWFVGVSGLPLRENGQWRPNVVVDLLPYDAGTDSGTTFTAANADITPHIPISLIDDYAFDNGTPLGTFTFELLTIPTPTAMTAFIAASFLLSRTGRRRIAVATR